MVSLKVSAAICPNRDQAIQKVTQDKENLTSKRKPLNNEDFQRQKQLWLRVLLLYGSNQHFVKPVNVCPQHQKEKFLGKSNMTENIKGYNISEPMNLSKSFVNNVMDADEEVICQFYVDIYLHFCKYNNEEHISFYLVIFFKF